MKNISLTFYPKHDFLSNFTSKTVSFYKSKPDDQ